MQPNKSPEREPVNASPYTRISLIYDRLMTHVNYRQWARYIDRLMRRVSSTPEWRLMDVGCGTGRFLEELAKLGRYGDGCDPSPEMLAIARKRLPEAAFSNCSMPDLTGVPAGVYPIITCLYDTMNYLDDLDSFKQTLNRIYDTLPPEGVFVFDLVSKSHCEFYFKNYSDSEVLSDNLAYKRESHFESQTGRQYNWVQIHTPEGIFEEEHLQTIFDFADIHELIQAETGFELSGFYDEFTFDEADDESGRVHYLLTRPGPSPSCQEPESR